MTKNGCCEMTVGGIVVCTVDVLQCFRLEV